MSNATPISAVVITSGDRPHLADTLTSLAWCDELVVLVSHDVEAVRSLPAALGCRVEPRCRIETHPFDGYGPQKRRAVALARHDWILSLDDDECLDEEATQAICSANLDGTACSYDLRRRTFVGDREIHHGPWGRERVVRLFDRRTCSFADLAVHEAVKGPRPAARLAGSILHYSFESCSDVLARSIRYARPKAGIIRGKKQAAHAWMLPLRAAAAFGKSYLLQSGYRDGAAGFAIALSRVIDSTLPRILVLTEADTPPDSQAEPR